MVVVLYVVDSAVAGCLVAERVNQAYRVVAEVGNIHMFFPTINIQKTFYIISFIF